MPLLIDLKAALMRMLRGGQITLAAEARRALQLSDGAFPRPAGEKWGGDAEVRRGGHVP